jgi:glycyl-tRNA synthetase beta chain
MDRELLIEIGVEELPASWLPSLTTQLAEVASAQLKAARLDVDGPVESWTTPRRLTVRVARVAERQTDLEEVVSGPPVAAARGGDGQLTQAALGFAKKNGVEPDALEEIETPKGRYLAVRRRQRGKACVDALPEVMTGLLRGLAFPKTMNWDAWLEDGKGDFRFGRPVRWLLFLYGGRVVPYDIRRTEGAQSPLVQDVRSGPMTYGHRFLTTSGRAGRAVKVKTFDDYKARLMEHFVVLEREDRRERIARELDVHAGRLGGRVHRAAAGQAGLLDEVPDLVEWPAVVAGVFSAEFLALPEEVLTTTMIHHQHYFPVVDDHGRLKPAFLAVTNVEVERPELISRNAERVLTARLRDAQFFWNADRAVALEDRIPRLDTILFHKKLGSYRAKAERVERLAAWVAAEALGASAATSAAAAKAGRLCKADLGTDLVREFTELQGTMGGIYAREEGLPEPVWKAIYHHYLPVAVEPDAPPSRAQLGAAASTWAAVAIADKLDTLVGLFSAGERPTGSRDPHGLRRQAHGLFRALVDLPELTGLTVRPTLGALVAAAEQALPLDDAARTALTAFLTERLTYVLEQRGYDIRNVRAVLAGQPLGAISPLVARRMLEVLPEFTGTPEFQQLATAFKRVKNIAGTKGSDPIVPGADARSDTGVDPYAALTEPAELALVAELRRRQPVIEQVLEAGDHYRQAFAEAAGFGPFVDRFFSDVFVMVEDPALRRARLHLMRSLARLILRLADISEIVPQSES